MLLAALSVLPPLLAASRGHGGSGGLPAFLFVLVIFLVVGAVAVRAGIRQQRQALAQLTGLASRFHLELRQAPVGAGPLVLRAPPTVGGTYRNRAVRFFTFTTGSGKSRTRWCAVAAAGGAGGFTLDLTHQSFLSRVGTALGMQDLQVGDPAFDPLFVVKSNDPAFAAAALLPEIRGKLVDAQRRGALGHLRIKDGEVRYAEIGGFDQPARAARLGDLLDLVCDLAEVADVYRQT